MKKEILEVWKPIPGYEEQYEVSNLGRVRSLTRQLPGKYKRIRKGQLLKPRLNREGYYEVSLCKYNKLRYARVHILVLEAFVGLRLKGYNGLHRNDVKTDNVLNNLYWGTHQENAEDARKNGKLSHKGGGKGERGAKTKLTEEDVLYIRANYRPRNPEFSSVSLAKRFSVTHWTIEYIIHRETWKHI